MKISKTHISLTMNQLWLQKPKRGFGQIQMWCDVCIGYSHCWMVMLLSLMLMLMMVMSSKFVVYLKSSKLVSLLMISVAFFNDRIIIIIIPTTYLDCSKRDKPTVLRKFFLLLFFLVSVNLLLNLFLKVKIVFNAIA